MEWSNILEHLQAKVPPELVAHNDAHAHPTQVRLEHLAFVLGTEVKWCEATYARVCTDAVHATVMHAVMNELLTLAKNNSAILSLIPNHLQELQRALPRLRDALRG